MYRIEKTLAEVVRQTNSFDDASKKKLTDEINTRFTYFVEQALSYIIEDYIENEWRDSFDLYYSKTQYDCSNLVKRVHFIKDDINNIDEVNNENYIGYINLRPLPIFQISRIRFKCTRHAFVECESNSIYCLSIDTSVNLPHITIKFNSFPIYSQDGMVAICAHADLLMISKYMYKQFNFNNYKLKDIVKNNLISNDNGRRVPSEGLNVLQMIDILKVNNYNPIATRFQNAYYNKISIIEYIDSFLESALPVILAFDGHVVVVIGHMHNNEKHYVIADDSTYHIQKSFKKQEAHVAVISEKQLLENFTKNTVFVIAPTFDRFYLHYQNLKLIVNFEKDKLRASYNQLDIEGDAEFNILSREILVESREIKQFLHNCGDRSYESILMPHYIWYIEFYLNVRSREKLSHYMIVDASAHKYDRKYSIIKNKDGVSINFADMTMTTKDQLSKLKAI